jgi:hypothetical protein
VADVSGDYRVVEFCAMGHVTYAGKGVHHVTKFFEKQDLGVAYKTTSNIGKILKHEH